MQRMTSVTQYTNTHIAVSMVHAIATQIIMASGHM